MTASMTTINQIINLGQDVLESVIALFKLETHKRDNKCTHQHAEKCETERRNVSIIVAKLNNGFFEDYPY